MYAAECASQKCARPRLSGFSDNEGETTNSNGADDSCLVGGEYIHRSSLFEIDIVQCGSCPMHHTGYCISGTLVVRMLNTGTSTRIAPGDFFEIPPGHDGHVEGDDRVELVLFAPPEHQH